MRNMIRRSIVVACVLFVFTLIYSMLGLNFMDIAIHLLGIVQALTLLASIINVFIAMRLMGTKSEKWPNYKYNVYIFIFVMCALFTVDLVIVSSIMERKARKEVITFLKQIDDIEKTTIKVNSKEIDQEKKLYLYYALRNTGMISTSWAHSSKEVDCEIIYGDKIMDLKISRNLGKRSQYWVLYPKYRYTRNNWIGGFYIDEIIDLVPFERY